MKKAVQTIVFASVLGSATSICAPALGQSASSVGNPFSYSYQGASLTLGGRGGEFGSGSPYGRGDRLNTQGYYRMPLESDVGSRTWSSREVTSGHADPVYRATDLR